MMQRIIPAVIGITLLISGCATQQATQNIADFSVGATLLKVANLPSQTADGSRLFITVDGQQAGSLPAGKAMLLQLPAGEHQVGGYARSLIGSVTIPGVNVTTSPDAPRFVAYQIIRNTPRFIVRGVDPLPQSAPIPEKQTSQSEPVPVPQMIQLSIPESTPKVVATASPTALEPVKAENTPPIAPESVPEMSAATDSAKVKNVAEPSPARTPTDGGVSETSSPPSATQAVEESLAPSAITKE